MARRGRFGTGGQGGNIAGDVIKNILRMQGTGDASTVTETPAPTPAPKPKSLTQEQIAADPVLSGRLSLDQAKVQHIRTQQLIQSMPNGEWTPAQTSKLQKQFKNLPFDAREAESRYYALGGMTTSKDGSTSYGYSNRKILELYRAAGMEDKGYEIIAQRTGFDRYGNPVQVNKALTATYKDDGTGLGPMVSPIKGLNATQAARLERLKNLKKSGETLTPKQKEKIKKLKGLAKG